MPVVLYLGAVGYAESETGKDVAYLLLHQGDGMARAQSRGIGRAGEVQLVRSIACCTDLHTLAEGIDMLLGAGLQLVEHLADLFFLLGRHEPEVIEETGYHAFLTEILDAQGFCLFDGSGHALAYFV